MIVERAYFAVKMGCTEELIKACRAQQHWWDERKVNIRVYTSVYSPRFEVCMEFEYDSLAECEKIENEWVESPEYAELMKSWVDLAREGGRIEVWQVESR